MPSDPPSAGRDAAASASSAMSSAMSTAMNQAKSMTDELTQMFSQMRLPAMPDSEKLLSAHQRNIEALTQANRVAMEGAQAVARRHMEIMQQTMAELGDTMRSLSTTDAPQEKAAKQAELLKRAYERALANTREISEMIQHANGEALGLLNKRFAEAMDEVKALTHQAGAKPE